MWNNRCMEHILLTAFLCFVAFVALGQAAYACPRHEHAAKLYAPPARSSRVAGTNDANATNDVVLTLIGGGKEECATPERATETVRHAA